MKQMQKRKKQWLRCVGGGLAAVMVLALPVDWAKAGRRAALMAAGLRQPAQAVQVLGGQWRPTDTTVSVGVTDPTAEQPTADTTSPTQTTEKDTTVPPITMTDPPARQKGSRAVVEKTMPRGAVGGSGLAVANRAGKSVDVAAALKRDLDLEWADTDAPQVLILHTHTTEAYLTYEADYCNPADRARTRDHKKNVCAVGEAVRLTLAQAGIAAIHDTTVHDSPQYNGAYSRSADTAAAYLKKYPTIKVVLDLHRDAVMEGSAVVRPTATVEGKKAAQMMLITGVVSTAAQPHKQWGKNLTLSTHLQQSLTALSPDLMRPLNVVASRYNQHLSPGWVLVEVGAEGNTVEEAVYAGQLLARALAALPD